MNKNPLVSVCVITYQHVNYIKQCLDGILMQQTSFPIEIILGEDESTDGTRDICISYSNKYPDKINLFLRQRKDVIYINGNPTGRYNFVESLKACKGKYIAYCDGDDYWTDPLKLQKQADFLENNFEFIIIGNNAKRVFNDKEDNKSVKNIQSEFITVSTDNLIQGNSFVSSMTMFRNKDLTEIMPHFLKFPVGDWPLFTFLSFKGKCGFFDESVGYYRVHNGSITSSNRSDYSNFKNELINKIEHAKFWNSFSDNKFSEAENIVFKKRSRQICNIAIRNHDFKTAIHYSQYINIGDLTKIKSKFVVFLMKFIFKLLK